MEDYKISNLIKELRKEKRYTIANLADKCGISVRGLSKWFSKSDREWNMDSLMILSKILDFKIIISGGIIEVMRSNEQLNNLEQDIKEVYNVYKDLGDYSIVNLYTPNTNLSYDKIPELLEDFFVFSNEIDCKREFPNDNPIKVYGLLNNSINSIELDRLTSIYPYKAENYYYFNLAPVVSTTEDGYEIVAEFKNKGMKLVKAGAILEKNLDSDGYNLKEYTNNLGDNKSILGFTLLPINSNSSKDFVGWAENLKHLYDEVFNEGYIRDRYFDRNRNEIFEGDILIKRGFNKGVEDIFEKDNNGSFINNYFKNQESVRVEVFKNQLGFNLKGNVFFIYELNLLKWEKITYEE